jgi:hypothetical protein
METPLLQFSSFSYVPEMKATWIMGGFSDTALTSSKIMQTSFSAQVQKITEKEVNAFESVYTYQTMNPMKH